MCEFEIFAPYFEIPFGWVSQAEAPLGGLGLGVGASLIQKKLNERSILSEAELELIKRMGQSLKLSTTRNYKNV